MEIAISASALRLAGQDQGDHLGDQLPLCPASSPIRYVDLNHSIATKGGDSTFAASRSNDAKFRQWLVEARLSTARNPSDPLNLLSFAKWFRWSKRFKWLLRDLLLKICSRRHGREDIVED